MSQTAGHSALVSSAHVKEIAPVQYACETVLFVNGERQQLASLHVLGGIEKYQEAFFSSDFLANHAGHLEHVFQLHQIVEQMRILDAELTLHGKLAPPEVQPLHKKLVECLAQMKQFDNVDR